MTETAPTPASEVLNQGQTTRTNVLAILSLVCGLVSIFTFWLGPTVPAAAIVLGHVARNKIRKSNGAQRGAGIAKAGLIIGYIMMVVLGALMIALDIYARSYMMSWLSS